MPNIKITAKSEPYRRAGISHARAGTVYAAGHFTDEQLARLRADPRLVVTETDETPALVLVDAQSLRDAAVAAFLREAERRAADKAQEAGENWPGMSAFERESRINCALSDFITMAQPVEATRNADLAAPEPPVAKGVAKPATKVTTAKAPAKGKAK